MDTALKSFTLMEKTAGQWKGLRGSSSGSKSRMSLRPEDITRRREAFLKRQEMTEEEIAERGMKKTKAAVAVAKALKQKDDEGHHSRPLRRFKCKLVVVLVRVTTTPNCSQPMSFRAIADSSRSCAAGVHQVQPEDETRGYAEAHGCDGRQHQMG